jgi:RNA polymerase primary sigma factor
MRPIQIEKSFTQHNIQSLLTEAAKYKPLTSEQEVTATPEQLVKHNMLFVVSVAKQYGGKSSDLKDLIQEGMIGLVKASQRYDATKGFKFISYAVWYIQQSIVTYLRNQRNIIRISEHQNIANRKILELIDTHSEEEIKNKLNITESVFRNFIHNPITESMHEKFGEDDEYEKQYVSDENFFEDYENKDMADRIKIMMEKLSYKEQHIIYQVYLVPFPKTWQELAIEIKMSVQGVRYLHNRALQKLKLKISAPDQ